jgi:GT2 family glycosyltransferase
VTGSVLYPESWERASNWVRFGNDNYRKTIRIHQREAVLPPNRFAGGNSSLRRETFLRVGCFDETIRRAEDVTMGCQLVEAGVTLLCEPTALVYHHADVILSIDRTLGSFRRSYEIDMSPIRAKYPWYFAKYGHWFLEPPNAAHDTLPRRLVKGIVRFIAHRGMQRAVVRFLKATDRARPLYWKPLYQYVMVCEAIDAIRSSPKAKTPGGRS